jgi:hypothetical protein
MEVAPTFTETATEESHPEEWVSLTRTVPVPAVVHCTLMLLPLLEPRIWPPVTVQEIVLEEAVCRKYVIVLYIQAEAGPEMTGVGVGLMTIARDTTESHPDVLCAVRVMDPVATLFQVTLIAVPVLLETAPPVTTQVYVVFAVTGVE